MESVLYSSKMTEDTHAVGAEKDWRSRGIDLLTGMPAEAGEGV